MDFVTGVAELDDSLLLFHLRPTLETAKGNGIEEMEKIKQTSPERCEMALQHGIVQTQDETDRG